MQDYWHQNHWFAKTFRAGTRALAAADKGPLSPPRSAAASGNEDPSERANGEADRRGSAPGLQITADRTEPSPPLDFDEENLSRSHHLAGSATAAVPYPLSQMKDSLERRNIRERLLRFNKPQKIGYLYVLSFGKFVGYYVVKGKVSSVQSQMTSQTQTYKDGRDDNASGQIPSIGDDGSFGPNEGGDRGVFFFTTQGVMVETTLDWVYSDAPLNIDVPNLLARKAK